MYGNFFLHKQAIYNFSIKPSTKDTVQCTDRKLENMQNHAQ